MIYTTLEMIQTWIDSEYKARFKIVGNLYKEGVGKLYYGAIVCSNDRDYNKMLIFYEEKDRSEDFVITECTLGYLFEKVEV